ncbi:DltD N-terminal domain protein [Didymella exigua CBS 183.55]|uniref:DltD N-terminal domain protein n=1 Tax=Didymella exigua CBS 183.55 TaxID=1150837 RepID=A0A6A5R4H1_9PLEO|nr:DltD N-terminal domain protein [Didymella exigua CBS 183.55]KAF1922289.1 DltD N-terminal domain protein [Didymella exigua CBS 183.55]
MKGREDVTFPTLDGLILRGWLYPAAKKGPAIIMTPGFNMTKETIINDVAEYYFAAGFTVLSYDPRSIGASDGLPRNEANPIKNMEDYMDALTFLKSHKVVDPNRIAYWGYSFSGMVALCAAALDKRAKAVIASAPLTIWEFKKWKPVLSKCMKDRESRLAGNKPVNLPMLTDTGEQPAGFGENFEGEGVLNIIARAVELQPNFKPETALSSYYHIAAFQPFSLLPFVTPTPAFVVYGEQDQISPAHLQKTLIYDALSHPKQLFTVPDKAHMNLVSGQGSERILDEQIKFLKSVWTKG